MLLASGSFLPPPSNELNTYIKALRRAAYETSNGIRYIQEDGTEFRESYRDLYAHAVRNLGALQQGLGLTRSDHVLLLTGSHPTFFRAFWGCALGGIIPCALPRPTTFSATDSRIQNIAAIYQQLAAHRKTVLLCDEEFLPRLRSCLPADVLLHSLEALQGAGSGVVAEDIQPGDTLFFQLTSGSTSVSKCVQIAHRMPIRYAQASRIVSRLAPDNISLNWLPLDHVGAIIAFHLRDLYHAYEQVQVPTDLVLANPLRWLEYLAKYRVHYSWSPNFGFKLVATAAREKELSRCWDLSRLHTILNAGEQVTKSVLVEFLDRTGLPSRVVKPVFGMAEVSTGITLNDDFDLDRSADVWAKQSLEGEGLLRKAGEGEPSVEFVDLGPPNPGVSIRIGSQSDPELALGECQIGQLQVKGENVTPGYYRNDAANAASFTSDGWFNTGDLAYLREGRLFIVGRAKETLNIRGVHFLSYELEQVVETTPGVLPTFSAACGFHDASSGSEALLLFFVPSDEVLGLPYDEGRADHCGDPRLRAVRTAIQRNIVTRFKLQPRHVIPVSRERFYKTTSGKIQRLRFREAFERGDYAPLLTASETAIRQTPVRGVDIEASLPASEVEPLREAVVQAIQAALGEEVSGALDWDQSLFEIGADSVKATQIRGRLMEVLARSFPVTLVYEHHTPRRLLRFLLGHPDPVEGEQLPVEAGAPSPGPVADEPIAVVGIACRFPGGANDPSSYWNLLFAGLNVTRDIPKERFDTEPWYDPQRPRAGHMYTRAAALLDQPVDQFDAAFFGILPREANILDPQQRLLLEVVWEAMEDANIPYTRLQRQLTGVFVGGSFFDYQRMTLAEEHDQRNHFAYTGTAPALLAGRVSYVFGWHGPSFAVDTTCSSALAAIHLACQSLRTSECEVAVAGGVNLILSPEHMAHMCQTNALAADGRSHVFDAAGDGFGRGEGCGIVLLKRLSQALADGDSIHAVIRGSAMNSDGHTSGITAPSRTAQEMVLRTALQRARVQPVEIDFVEAHGTGTPLGDPVELLALQTVYGQGGRRPTPFFLGSVKANIGHLEAAAGIASFLKVLLALRNDAIPPQPLFRERNSNLPPLEEVPAAIPLQPTAWERRPDRPRRAGISSFGFSGTNVHVIMEEAPARVESAPVLTPGRGQAVPSVLTLSAKSEPALRALIQRYVGWLSGPEGQGASWEDACYTASVGRSHFAVRRAICATSPVEALKVLATPVEDEIPRREGEPVRIAFLYSGQGSQHVGMGTGLYVSEPVFREAIETCDQVLRSLGAEIDLRALFDATAEGHAGISARLGGNDTLVVQPALFALEYALTRLWESWGVVPSAVLGHSLGEYVAACVAGVFSLESALQAVWSRARLMARLPDPGRMISIQAPLARVEERLALRGGGLSIAAINAPDAVVVSGAAAEVERLEQDLREAGIRFSPLEVANAFHSHLIEPVLAEFREVMDTLSYGRPRLPLLSNLTGELAQAAEIATADYWVRHMRGAVQYQRCVEAALQQKCNVFLELGPHTTLAGLGMRCTVEQGEAAPLWLPSLKKNVPDRQRLLETVAALYERGVEIDWESFHAPHKALRSRGVQLPRYPFQRQRYWLDNIPAEAEEVAGATVVPAAALQQVVPAREATGAFTLLGDALDVAPLDVLMFESRLERGPTLAWLSDHRVHASVVFPFTGFLDILAAGARTLGASAPGGNLPAGFRLRDIQVTAPLVLDSPEPLRLRVVCREPEEGASGGRLTQVHGFSPSTRTWVLHAQGTVLPGGAAAGTASGPRLLRTDAVEQSVEEFYAYFERLGMHYGPSFRSIRQLWTWPGGALARLSALPPAGNGARYAAIHPASLDAILQTAFAAAGGHRGGAFHAPIAVGQYQVHPALQDPVQPGGEQELLCLATVQSPSGGSVPAITADIRLFDARERPVAELSQLVLRRIEDKRSVFHRSEATAVRSGPPGTAGRELLYLTGWQPRTLEGQWRRSTARDFPSLPATVEELTARLPSGSRQMLQRLARNSDELDRLTTLHLLQALRELGCELRPGARISLPELVATHGISAFHARMAERLLELLAREGGLEREAGVAGPRWRVLRNLEAELSAQPPAALHARLQSAFGEEGLSHHELAMVQRCGAHLAAAWTGRVEPLQILFPETGPSAESLYRDAPMSVFYNELLRDTLRRFVEGLPPGRPLRILEIGAGTGSTTQFVLPILPADRVEYVFTDVSPFFLARAREKFGERYPFVEYRLLDAEKEPARQGFAHHQFDVILSTNCLHATADMVGTMRHVRQLLASEGLLLLIEMTTCENRWVDLIFGLTPGWWRITDTALRPSQPLLSRAQWRQVLAEVGFADPTCFPEVAGVEEPLESVIAARGPRLEPVREEEARLATAAPAPKQPEPGPVLLLVEAGQRAAIERGLDRARPEQGPRRIVVELAPATESAPVRRLSARHYIVQPTPEALGRLFSEPDLPAPSEVIYAWPAALARQSSPEALSPEALRQVERRICEGFLGLVQSLLRSQGDRLPRLRVLLQEVEGPETAPSLAGLLQSPLLGLMRSLEHEVPGLRATCIDMGPVADEDALSAAAAAVAREPDSTDGVAESLVSYRNGARWVARLACLGQEDRRDSPRLLLPAPAAEAGPYRVSADGTYLITGGFGGLGLLLAESLIGQGARSVVLLGRRPPSAQVQARVAELTRRGASIRTLVADVADRDALARALAELSRSLPPLRGVIHAAGTLANAALPQQTWEHFETVFAAKVHGAWNLHVLTKDLPTVDLFVLFSSAASTLGSAGQANHAAANAFMDTLARYRRGQGLPAISVQWSAWSEVGAAASATVQGYLSSRGILSFDPPTGLSILRQVIDQRAAMASVAVLRMDWPRFLARLGRTSSFLSLMSASESVSQPARPVMAGTASAQPMATGPTRAGLEEAVSTITRAALQVPTLGPDAALAEAGMDSLVAIELRNRLQKRFQVELPASFAFDFPTVRRMAEHLHGLLGVQQPTGAEESAGKASTESQSQPPLATPSAVLEEVARLVRSSLQLPELALDTSLVEAGMDSLVALGIRQRLQTHFACELPTTLAFDHPTIREIASFVAERLGTPASPTPAPAPVLQARPERAPLEVRSSAPTVASVASGPREEALTLSSLPRAPLDPENAHEPFPITHLAQSYYAAQFLPQFGIRSHTYAVEVFQGLDVARFERALQRVIAHHAVLRARILPSGEFQVMPMAPRFQVPITDARGLGPARQQEVLDELRQRRAKLGKNTTWPFFYFHAVLLDDGKVALALDADSLLLDLMTWHLVMRDLTLAYHDTELPPLPALSYRDYALHYHRLKDSEQARAEREYWWRRLETFPEPPELPKVPLSQRPKQHPGFRHHEYRLPAERWQRIYRQITARGLQASAAVCAALATVISTFSNSKHFFLTSMFLNRVPFHPEVMAFAGYSMSTFLLEVDFRDTPTFEEKARRLQRELLESQVHSQFITGNDVIAELNRRRGRPMQPVSPVSFASLFFRTNNPRIGALNDTGGLSEESGISFTSFLEPPWRDFLLEIGGIELDNTMGLTSSGDFFLNWDAIRDLFPQGLAEDMLHAYTHLIEAMAEDGTWSGTSLNLVSPEGQRLQSLANSTSPRMWSEFVRQATSPEGAGRSAVVSASRALTYQELLCTAQALAAELQRRGTRPGELVAVSLPKSVEQVLAVLGIQLAGSAYVPIDPELPQERRAYLISKTRARFLLTTRSVDETLRWPEGLERLQVDAFPVLSTPPRDYQWPEIADEDVAYVIFTSGSTGQPKGVTISHKAAVNTLDDINARFRVGPADRVLAVSSLSFDLSVYDIFGTLSAGGCIVMPDDARKKDPAHWASLMVEQGVSIWNSAPQLMDVMTQYAGARSGSTAGHPFRSLRLVMMSGDWIPVDLPDRIRAAHPHAGSLQVVSLGGATEAAIWSVWYPIGKVPPDWPSIPYGKPLRNQTCYVLDDQLQPCPPYVQGDLYIGGDGLALGYWDEPELTAKAFIHHPERKLRLYRTGDLARYHRDGNLEFLGRADFQVKISGYRIELGEIENALTQHPGIQAAVVRAFGDRHDRKLVAYFVPHTPEAVQVQELQRFLQERLPAYMVPALFLAIDAVPLSTNGKVDSSRLPDPLQHAGAGRSEAGRKERSGRAPSTTDRVEQVLAGSWEKLLNLSPGSLLTGDHFFELGGNSFRIIQLKSMVDQSFQVDADLSRLLTHPVFADMAQVVRDALASSAQGARSWTPLIPLQPEGPARPFFCVHPSGGNVICYAGIARIFGEKGWPFLGLEARGMLSEDLPPLTTVEEMAALYVAAIREVQPQGPYLLGGWSSGGILAFEMARQLRRAGQVVEKVLMIDSPAPLPDREVDVAALRVFFDEDIQRGTGGALELPADQRERLWRVFESTIRAEYRYRFPVEEGLPCEQLWLLRAERTAAEGLLVHPGAEQRDWAWGRLLGDTAGFHITDISGDHYTALQEPNIPVLASSLLWILGEERPEDRQPLASGK